MYWGVEPTNIHYEIMQLEGIIRAATRAREYLLNAIRRCINCGTPLADNTSYCERCGFENNDLLK